MKTQRRRFFWAAWWTERPSASPFRKPDASCGGFATLEAAHANAETQAGRTLSRIEPEWARAWMRVVRGHDAWPDKVGVPEAGPHAERKALDGVANAPSVWERLGLSHKASRADIRQAFKALALSMHPDHGGDPAAFRALRQAYEEALKRKR
jgi:DnaJ domain